MTLAHLGLSWLSGTGSKVRVDPLRKGVVLLKDADVGSLLKKPFYFNKLVANILGKVFFSGSWLSRPILNSFETGLGNETGLLQLTSNLFRRNTEGMWPYWLLVLMLLTIGQVLEYHVLVYSIFTWLPNSKTLQWTMQMTPTSTNWWSKGHTKYVFGSINVLAETWSKEDSCITGWKYI